METLPAFMTTPVGALTLKLARSARGMARTVFPGDKSVSAGDTTNTYGVVELAFKPPWAGSDWIGNGSGNIIVLDLSLIQSVMFRGITAPINPEEKRVMQQDSR
jgi:hypothetical protein